MLVLAIAGLIFLTVFIALPALQRSQRDTQRKQDMTRLKDALERYKGNNRGQLPWTIDSRAGSLANQNFGNNYLNVDKGEWQDPSWGTYSVSVNNISAIEGGYMEGWVHPGFYRYADSNIVFIFIGYRCDGVRVVSASGPTNYAITYALDSGGTGCLDG